MAAEIRRIAKSLLGTDPELLVCHGAAHFHVPGWHWMPLSVRVAMLRKWKCGWLGRTDSAQARERVTEVRLMTSSGTARDFPWCQADTGTLRGLR